MTTRRLHLAPLISVLVLPIVALGAGAEPAPARAVKQSTTVAGSSRRCRSDEEAFTVLKLTTIEGGVRVDYEFVRPGQASWTNMNRPLLRQFGVRVGATICLPRDPTSDETTDFD